MALSKQPDMFLWQYHKVMINDSNCMKEVITHATQVPISTGTFQKWEEIKTGSIQGNMVYKINAIPRQNHLIRLTPQCANQ